MRAPPAFGIGGLLLVAGAALLAAPAAAVQVTAGNGSALAGQSVDISINTGSLTGLSVVSYQFVLNYNPSVATASAVVTTATLTAAAGWATPVFNTTSGSISVSAAGTTALSGAGALIKIHFDVDPSLLNGSSTGLTLPSQSFLFNEGLPIDSTSNGTLTVPATPQIQVSPDNGEVVRAQALQMSVFGSVTNPVSWFTTNGAIATISASGLLSGVAPGAVRVYAVDAATRRDTTNSDILVRGMGVTVGTGSVFQGNSVSIPVTVTSLNGLGIRSGQLTVSYNPNLVTPTGVTTPPGTLLNGYGPIGFGTTGSSLTVDFAGGSDLTGAGTLCNLSFTAGTAFSGTSALLLDNALFNEVLPAKKTNGSVAVNPLPSIGVSPDQVTLLAGQTQSFTVTGSPNPPVTWSTLDPTIATINPSTGLLTAVSGGLTRVQAVDHVGASDLNTSVTVFDFKVTVGSVNCPAGGTVDVPITLDRNIDALNVRSLQYTMSFNPTNVADAGASSSGLVSIWGNPTWLFAGDHLNVATAGVSPLGSGNLLHALSFQVSPAAALNSNIPLTLSSLVFNEGKPVAQVVNGNIHVQGTLDVDGGLMASFALEPLCPNPAAAMSRIAYSIPATGPGGEPVRLAILGLDGRVVRTLRNGPQEAGAHAEVWDGRDDAGRRVAAGVYFCRLEWRGLHRERKLAWMR